MEHRKRAAESLLACLLVPAACFAGAARAQSLPAPQPQAGGEEIVITATYRATPVLDIPASVTVLTSDRLDDAHITTVKQAITLAPALNVINSIGESFGQLIAVRGVATSGADVGLESTLGITVDGVPLLRPNLAIFDLQGVDRIEFLKGPQGTLFGANTTAGIINVLTKPPSFMPRYEVSATFGERNERELRVSAEGALAGSKLAGRIDALIGAVDGYLPNPNTGEVYGGRHRQEARVQLLWTPTQDVDVRLIADGLHHGGTVNSPVYHVVGPTGAIITGLTGLPLIASQHARDLAQIDDDAPRFERNDSAGLSAETNWQTGAGQLTAIASYRSATMRRSYDVDNSPADIANDPHDGERYHRGRWNCAFAGSRDRSITFWAPMPAAV